MKKIFFSSLAVFVLGSALVVVLFSSLFNALGDGVLGIAKRMDRVGDRLKAKGG